jgi:hypothetical protein
LGRRLARRHRRAGRRPRARQRRTRRGAAPRGKEGLGRAYLAGFRVALDAGAEAILQMDCDFSHRPGDIPALLAALPGADMVLG